MFACLFAWNDPITAVSVSIEQVGITLVSSPDQGVLGSRLEVLLIQEQWLWCESSLRINLSNLNFVGGACPQTLPDACVF